MKEEKLNNEADILQRLQKGEESALRELVDMYRPQMLMEAYYLLRDMAEAEDIVQEVFIRFWNLKDRVELKPSLLAYLLRATRNESIIKIKKDKTRDKKQHGYNYFLESSTQMKPFESAELAEQLQSAIEHIPPAARKSFIKLYLEDKSQKTIAAEQNISLQVVKNNISKALKILREKLHTAK
ncbi:RNA polymerase sigma factor [Chitinophaga rhizophila]|uniref:Sigma-70 family RNA polymerase sigma factor n=1 Tax=Chitinophaga rhizophila TaxID=2866212 RepID=A0ABS7GE20_9BACT|nr:sigma-70 family RNA polymerase sigma factor [Chitinophaga rhizophila]MBW8685576.1 sigma-70 family RNA polymerase sigma factor [Chitinophaga rhizophila]